MSIAGLISQYGYTALFFGAFLEGETFLILGGFAAHRGYLELPWVMVTAMVGGFLGDQFYFWLGRRHGSWVRARFPTLEPGFQRANRLIERHHMPLIVGVRFLYGVRTVGPVAIGMSGVPVWRFALLNGLGAVIWSVLIGGAGYVFGQVLQGLIEDVKSIEDKIILGILAVSLAWQLARRVRSRRRHPPTPTTGQEAGRGPGRTAR